jgi:hypothetical protein
MYGSTDFFAILGVLIGALIGHWLARSSRRSDAMVSAYRELRGAALSFSPQSEFDRMQRLRASADPRDHERLESLKATVIEQITALFAAVSSVCLVDANKARLTAADVLLRRAKDITGAMKAGDPPQVQRCVKEYSDAFDKLCALIDGGKLLR